MDGASIAASLSIQRYRTIEVIGHEGFSWPAARVQEQLLIDEIISIGKSIHAQREVDRAKYGDD